MIQMLIPIGLEAVAMELQKVSIRVPRIRNQAKNAEVLYLAIKMHYSFGIYPFQLLIPFTFSH